MSSLEVLFAEGWESPNTQTYRVVLLYVVRLDAGQMLMSSSRKKGYKLINFIGRLIKRNTSN